MADALPRRALQTDMTAGAGNNVQDNPGNYLDMTDANAEALLFVVALAPSLSRLCRAAALGAGAKLGKMGWPTSFPREVCRPRRRSSPATILL